MKKNQHEEVFYCMNIQEALVKRHKYEKALGYSVKFVIPSAKKGEGFYKIIYEGTIRPEDMWPTVDETPTEKLPSVAYNGRIMERIIVTKKVPYTMSRHTYNGKRIRLYN